MMTLDQVLTLINNLDMREPLRRYGPKWSTVFVGRSGEILGVHRHKEPIEKSPSQEREDARQHPPGTVYFIAKPGLLTTYEQLAGKIKDALWFYEHEADIEANPNQKWFRREL